MTKQKARLARWKQDLQIAGSWLTAPLVYLSFAELIYSNSVVMKNIFPSHLSYLLFSGLLFLPVFKIMAKIVIKTGLYEAERDYDVSINPYTINKLTEKEKIVWVVTIATCHAQLAMMENLDLANSPEYYTVKNSLKALEEMLNVA